MVRRVFIGVLIVALVIVLLSIFLKKPNKSNNPVYAIPKSAAVIIKANGFLKLATELNDNNFYQNAFNDSIKNEIGSLKYSLDSFSSENASIKRAITDSSIYISFHFNKDNSKGINAYLPFGTLTDFDVVAAKFYFFLRRGELIYSNTIL